MYVVLLRTPCYLMLPIGKSLEGLNREIEGELRSLSSSSFQCLIKCAIEKVSHIGMKERWNPVFLEVNLIFLLKEIIKTWNHNFQHLQVSLTRDSLFQDVRPN